MISDYREKVTIQKSVRTMDVYGNWKNDWNDMYFCHAKVNSLYGEEYYAAEQVNQGESLDFTLRFHLGLMDLNTIEYRIVFRGKVYDIEHIDFLSFKRKDIKIRGKLQERQDAVSENK